MSKSNRSHGSQFLHDLVTVDFSKVDIYIGVRIATLLAPLLVVGLITHTLTGFVITGFIWVVAMDEILPTGHRTRTLLSLSALYASIFAIGMLVSLTNYLVVPLLAIGLFFLSYLRVFPRAFMVLFWSALVYAVGVTIPIPHLTLPLIGGASLLFFIGGLWVIVAGRVFPARKYLKPHTATDQSVQQQHPQQQPPAKLTRQDKYKLFTSNLSIHSQYFQYALALALTGAVGLLIIQWFDLNQPPWVLIAIVIVLVRPQFDISMNVYKDVHRVIGTFIGAIIAIGIISIIDNQWLLTLLTLLFAAAYGFFVKTGNYAFMVIFMTPTILIALDIVSPSTALMDSYSRFLNTAIGCLLSLIVITIFWIVSKTKSNQALRKLG